MLRKWESAASPLRRFRGASLTLLRRSGVAVALVVLMAAPLLHFPLQACVSCEEPEYAQFKLLRRMDAIPEGYRERFLLTSGVPEDRWREAYEKALRKHLRAGADNETIYRDDTVALRFGVEAAWKLGYVDEAENFKKLIAIPVVYDETKYVALLALRVWEPKFVREQLDAKQPLVASAAVLILAGDEGAKTQSLLDRYARKREAEHPLLRDAFEQVRALRKCRAEYAALQNTPDRLRYLQPLVVMGRSWEYHRNIGAANPSVMWARQEWLELSSQNPEEVARFVAAINYKDYEEGFQDGWESNPYNGELAGLRAVYVDASGDAAKRAFLNSLGVAAEP